MRRDHRPSFLRGAAASSLRQVRKIVIGVVGVMLLLVGAALLVLPGPGLVVLVVALGLLSLEFAWARTWLKRVKAKARDVRAGAARYVPMLRERDV
jgi:tellurite resistance protein TerC